MPRLRATYRDVIEVLLASGFVRQPTGATSHQQFRGEVAGIVRIVTVKPHRMNDDVPLGTLKSIIRQSGLPERLFRR
ncbi:MAG: type II toxin-antitoxin system HicA family toxin [Thermaurantiacus tibetensis]